MRPTPLHRLQRLSEDLGIDLWIKRDDLTGFALGGNKARKIEYLIADALSAFGLDPTTPPSSHTPKRPHSRTPTRPSSPGVVVTCGAAQSNFIRQLGAACAMFGIQCAAAVMRLPYFKAAGRPSPLSGGGPASKASWGGGFGELGWGVPIGVEGGNALIDRLLGVDVRTFPDGDWQTLESHAEEIAREYEAKGRRVFRIPIGGSGPKSAFAFFEAAKEAEDQAGRFDAIVTASSSGSTHAGLAYYHHASPTNAATPQRRNTATPQRRNTATPTRVIGICPDDDPEGELLADIVKLCRSLDSLTGGSKNMAAKDLELRMEWFGAGYNVPSEAGNAAIAIMARREGIFLDPVYTGKAFAGLLDLVKSGEIKGRILFWHTGGTPTLFASA